jgi:hypothetical protein
MRTLREAVGASLIVGDSRPVSAGESMAGAVLDPVTDAATSHQSAMFGPSVGDCPGPAPDAP